MILFNTHQLITEVRLIPYKLKLNRPLNFISPDKSSPKILDKKGYFLTCQITDFIENIDNINRKEQFQLFSDVPYLFGFTSGSLMDISKQFTTLKDSFKNKSLPLTKIKKHILHPSLLFGFDCLDLFAEMFFTSSSIHSDPFIIKKNTLINIHGQLSNLKEEINKLDKKSNEAIKIKLGQGNIIEEAERTKIVIRLLSRPVRLDVNRIWDEKECLDFISLLGNDKKWIDYLEEPLKPHYGLTGLKKLFVATGVPYALDETFRDLYQQNRVNVIENYFNKGLKAVVVKPSLGPSLSACEQFLKLYQTEIKWVISSAFETDLGLLALGYFIKKNGLAEQTGGHGLDTYRWIKDSYLQSPILETKDGLKFPLKRIFLKTKFSRFFQDTEN